MGRFRAERRRRGLCSPATSLVPPSCSALPRSDCSRTERPTPRRTAASTPPPPQLDQVHRCPCTGSTPNGRRSCPCTCCHMAAAAESRCRRAAFVDTPPGLRTRRTRTAASTVAAALGNGSLPSAVSFTTESAKHTATYLTRRVLIWQLVRRSLTASSRYGTKLRVRQLSEFLRTGSALYSAVDAEAVARTGCCIRCAEWKAFSEWCESLARR